MVLSKATAVFLFHLLGPAAARLCGDEGVLKSGDVCEQENQVCGRCECNSSGRWVCEDSTTRDGDDCATIDFMEECNEDGKQCGDCKCTSNQWVCDGGFLDTEALRELQISDEECEAINFSNNMESCPEANKICGNCVCDEISEGLLGWVCARGARAQQCLGVEDGKFCRWIERGEKCGDCECMPNNRWSCPAASKNFCDNVDDGKFCPWADRGSMCGTCFCAEGSWRCPEKLCNNIFPGKFCLWRNRGRKCFGCECVANRWVCPETTPTRQELCAGDIYFRGICNWRDEGRMCGEFVCVFLSWLRPAELCPMINSCSGEHSIEGSGDFFSQVFWCTLPAGLRGLELTLEKTSGDIDLRLSNVEWQDRTAPGNVPGSGESIFFGDFAEGELVYEQNPDFYDGESPGTDQITHSSSTGVIVNLSWNTDFPSRATVYGYELEATSDGNDGEGSATLTYRWTCNEDPALACACALE